jgi:hypothetical protein
MSKHKVFLNLPWTEMNKKDAIFEIYQDGEKFGRITISKGAIEWYPYKAKVPYKLSWSRFDKMIKNND